jgi:hypothetical protein
MWECFCVRVLKWVAACCVLVLANSWALAQEREWLLDAAGEDVFLVFGVPGTADVGVSFWCKLGSRKASLFAPIPTAATKRIPNKVTLGIGKKTFVLRAQPLQQPQLQSIEAKLVPQDDIISRLRAEDSFSMTVGTHKATYPLNGADFDGLLKLCNQDLSKSDN